MSTVTIKDNALDLVWLPAILRYPDVVKRVWYGWHATIVLTNDKIGCLLSQRVISNDKHLMPTRIFFTSGRERGCTLTMWKGNAMYHFGYLLYFWIIILVYLLETHLSVEQGMRVGVALQGDMLGLFLILIWKSWITCLDGVDLPYMLAFRVFVIHMLLFPTAHGWSTWSVSIYFLFDSVGFMFNVTFAVNTIRVMHRAIDGGVTLIFLGHVNLQRMSWRHLCIVIFFLIFLSPRITSTTSLTFAIVVIWVMARTGKTFCSKALAIHLHD